MGVSTGYLFGDSTPSSLKTDYIAFIRDVVDFAVEVLLCDARLADAGQRVAQLLDTTEKEIERADAIAGEVARALDRAPLGDPDSLAARCAARIRQGAKELVHSEAEAARAAVATERARAGQAAAGQHEACAKAFEGLVLRHELPEALSVIRLQVDSDAHYGAKLRGSTPYGLDWVVALQVAPSHALAHVLRIERIAERLEVEAPEEAGWIRKETKIRAQRFDRFYLSDLKIEPSETTMKLRAAPDGSGAGFDLLFTHEPRRVRLIRVFEAGDTPESPYDALGEDVVKLQALHDDVVAMARSLGEHKKSLVSASLDGTPLQQLEAPRELVERIVENIAPTVQEIAKRSLTRGELVLKRLLGDNHREELFVSKAELAQKVEALPVALRRAFEPLGLWESARSGAESPAPVRETISSKPEASAAVVASRSHIQTLPMTPVPAASPTPPGPDGPTASSPPLKPIAQSSQAAMAAQLPSSRPPRP